MFGFETKFKPALALLKNVPERRLFFSKFDYIWVTG
jgi:hypothetical protein